MKIGICGTGRMDRRSRQRLMSIGHEVGVWNRNSAKTKPLVDAGAKLFASAAELVEGSEVTIVMLLTTRNRGRLQRAERHSGRQTRRQACDRYEHDPPRDHEVERRVCVAAGCGVC